jgi:hypothetical protein
MRSKSKIYSWDIEHNDSYSGMITITPPATKFNSPKAEEPVSLTIPSEVLLEIAGRFMKSSQLLKLEGQSGIEVLLDRVHK